MGANIAAKISRSLRLGKPLDNFVGITELLGQVRQTARNLDNVGIVGKNGATLSMLAPSPAFPAEMVAAVPAGSQKSVHLQQENEHFVLFILEGRGGDPAGYLWFAFAEKTLQDQRLKIVADGLKISTALAAFALVVVFRTLLGVLLEMGTGSVAKEQSEIWRCMLPSSPREHRR